MRCRTGICGIRLFRGSRPKGLNDDDDDVQLVLLISIRHKTQFNTCIVIPYSAMPFFFFGWRSGPVTNLSLWLFRAFLKTYKKD